MGRGGGFRAAFPGGGVAVGGVATEQFVSDTSAPLAANDVTHSVFMAFTPPPADWLDLTNAGTRSHIIKPGVYGYTWLIDRVSNFADPTLTYEFDGFNITDHPVVDPGRGNTYPPGNHFKTQTGIMEIVSVNDADLPFGLSCGVLIPVDATGTLQVQLVLQRLAWKP